MSKPKKSRLNAHLVDIAIECKHCQLLFFPASHNQKYCKRNDCANSRRRKQRALETAKRKAKAPTPDLLRGTSNFKQQFRETAPKRKKIPKMIKGDDERMRERLRITLLNYPKMKLTRVALEGMPEKAFKEWK